MNKSNTAKQAFLKSLPVMAGYLVLGIGFGILLRSAGYGVTWALAMSLFIYAGSAQYVGISLITGGASILTAALTTLMVNARHLFYSISMIGRYKDAGKYKPYLIFALTDETYSLLCDGKIPDGADAGLYRFLVSFFDQCYWVAGSVAGSLLGTVLPFSTRGIEFSMTALFIASFTEQWLSEKDHIPAMTGLISSLVCLLIFGADRFLIPAMLLITLLLSVLRSREDRIHGPLSHEKKKQENPGNGEDSHEMKKQENPGNGEDSHEKEKQEYPGNGEDSHEMKKLEYPDNGEKMQGLSNLGEDSL